MPYPGARAGWPLARSAQAAVAAVALVDPLQALALRAHRLHPDSGLGPQASLLSQVSVWLYLVAALLFIRWLHRSRRNAEAFSPDPAALSPGWAVVGWF